MIALVVEDDETKRVELAKFFEIQNWIVNSVRCAADCMDELEKVYYDILVLDVCIPWDAEDPRDLPDYTHSNIVLKEIRRVGNACPGFVVGITQDEVVYEQVKELYERYGWSCLRYEKGQRWEDLLLERVRIANSQRRRFGPQPFGTDGLVKSQENQQNEPLPIGICCREDTSKSKALIMKGGGIKGLAYVGALKEIDSLHGFNWFVGTSAGAITAVLLAAGYTADELEKILSSKNFKEFFDASLLNAVLNLFFHKGLYKADSLTTWLDLLLAEKLGLNDRARASDLPHRLTILASQRGRRVVVFDSREMPDFSPAHAARCSMAIPYIFTPQILEGMRAFDGGLQNNFPIVEALRIEPNLDFVALYLGNEIYSPKSKSVLGDIFAIFTEAGDQELIREYRERTVLIDPSPIGTLDFDLSSEEKDLLLAAGRLGAARFMKLDSEAECRGIRNHLRGRVARLHRRRRYIRLAKGIFVLGSVIATVLLAF